MKKKNGTKQTIRKVISLAAGGLLCGFMSASGIAIPNLIIEVTSEDFAVSSSAHIAGFFNKVTDYFKEGAHKENFTRAENADSNQAIIYENLRVVRPLNNDGYVPLCSAKEIKFLKSNSDLKVNGTESITADNPYIAPNGERYLCKFETVLAKGGDNARVYVKILHIVPTPFPEKRYNIDMSFEKGRFPNDDIVITPKQPQISVEADTFINTKLTCKGEANQPLGHYQCDYYGKQREPRIPVYFTGEIPFNVKLKGDKKTHTCSVFFNQDGFDKNRSDCQKIIDSTKNLSLSTIFDKNKKEYYLKWLYNPDLQPITPVQEANLKFNTSFKVSDISDNMPKIEISQFKLDGQEDYQMVNRACLDIKNKTLDPSAPIDCELSFRKQQEQPLTYQGKIGFLINHNECTMTYQNDRINPSDCNRIIQKFNGALSLSVNTKKETDADAYTIHWSYSPFSPIHISSKVSVFFQNDGVKPESLNGLVFNRWNNFGNETQTSKGQVALSQLVDNQEAFEIVKTVEGQAEPVFGRITIDDGRGDKNCFLQIQQDGSATHMGLFANACFDAFGGLFTERCIDASCTGNSCSGVNSGSAYCSVLTCQLKKLENCTERGAD